MVFCVIFDNLALVTTSFEITKVLSQYSFIASPEIRLPFSYLISWPVFFTNEILSLVKTFFILNPWELLTIKELIVLKNISDLIRVSSVTVVSFQVILTVSQGKPVDLNSIWFPKINLVLFELIVKLVAVEIKILSATNIVSILESANAVNKLVES